MNKLACALSAVVAFVSLLSASACAPTPGDQGNGCDLAAEAPCVAGLQCVVTSSEAPDDAGELVCSTGQSFCATSCVVDGDCPTGQICIENCDDGEGGSTAAGACFVGSSG